MNNAAMVALYARVSSEQQSKRGTIDSQIAALKERIQADGAQIVEDLCFIDAGVSGATLVRPQLERLRDAAALGTIDRLYILSPDRLARKYAHQALLMEELSACGVQVMFLNHAIGTTPEESLLLQMQGMIAEYERAKIAERNRRGKLHGAKRGNVNVLSGAPYGYRYIRRQLDGTPAHYVIELPQAATVKAMFQWVGLERLSIGEVVRRLAEAGTETASGKPFWDRSVVWGILRNPAYMGRAAFGKTQVRDHLHVRVRAQRHSADVPRKPYSTIRADPQQWIEIPVPAIISEALFHTVQEQLAENRKRARQRRDNAPLRLLQGLTVCGQCRYAYYAKKVSKAAAKGHQRDYAYYRCVGTDAYRFGGERICDNLQVRTDKLDDLVWQQVVELLRQPDRLRGEYERRLDVLERNEKNGFDTTSLDKQRLQLEKGKSRLIDSYADGIIDKADFEPKMQQLKNRLVQIEQQILESRRHGAVQSELFLVINRLEEFATAVTERLDTIDLETKRKIVLGLVKRVEIHKDEIVVVFRVDPQPPASSSENSNDSDEGLENMQHCRRRTHPALRSASIPSNQFPGLLLHRAL
ncbi:recombinase family protein (plasmid) [Cupriavidus sp. KK10]|uniref:recombinase family protein n=1 Tax=Cupriavidus sp. KK10 TaxID=1478019 RepID=UPI001BAC2647|nr:recombinase family protein [Cupriavidus sp. KK10]QUN32427.1 recombinase family protein [Cupriavidus sp. KK10]